LIPILKRNEKIEVKVRRERKRRLEEARNPTEREEAAHNNVVYNSNTLLYIHNKTILN